MIAVAGEALIDLIVDPQGGVAARPGGGPFNAARAIARIGQPATFLGCLSSDRFGQVLRANLDRDGVQVAPAEPVDAPTTLAVAEIDPAGVPAYRFYLSGTASAALQARQALDGIPADTIALHIGSLGLTMEPAATSLEQLVAHVPSGVMVMLDPNCRPGAIPARSEYLNRLGRIIRRVAVIKTSTEDLAYLLPGRSIEDAANFLLDAGPEAVIVTDGPRAVRGFVPGTEISAEVPPAEVVDTVGAGDAFGGAFLAWWTGHGLARADLRQPAAVRSAVLAALDAAALNCARRGAEPPWAHELAAQRSWSWLPQVSPAGPHSS
jgi:fructokinase